MIITAYSDDSFTASSQKGQMSVYINPDQYTHNYTIVYSNTQAQGSPKGSPEYNKTPSDTVNFQLIFDGTGVVPSPLPGKPPAPEDGIVTQINNFMGLALNYNGKIHSPNFIQLSWGTLVFNCRLQTLKLTYTLFKPDGTPLRAKADTTFIGFQDEQEIAKEAKASSPDMTHVVTVKSGDTLPLLCSNIYGSGLYYTEIAKVNGLTGFRELAPGSRIFFPPLSTGTATA
jgi:contractile injection system tube protein/LysM domain-containing protein